MFNFGTTHQLVSVVTLSTGMTSLCPATQDETRNHFAPHPTVLAVELRHLENLPQPIPFNDKIVARIASLICAFEASDADGRGDWQLGGQQALYSDAWSSLSAWAVKFGRWTHQ